MRVQLLLLVLLGLLQMSISQKCLNRAGQPLDWYVNIIIPGSTGDGYMFFQNTFTASQFQYTQDEPDAPTAHNYNTLKQINEQNLKFSAWNDEVPAGSNTTSSSTKAHSKTVIAYHPETGDGFIIIHSMPRYPGIVDGKINITIDDSQKIYGQHMLCITLEKSQVQDLLAITPIMRPNVYVSNINGAIMAKKSQGLFSFLNYTFGSTNARFIFKDGRINGSIFEDGLNQMLKSEIIAETWGRPSQDPWCVQPFPVQNSNFINYQDKIMWKMTQDHSKWAYAKANDYSCFGDMNRMTSQWKRGGAFYCLQNALLNSALKAITPTPTAC